MPNEQQPGGIDNENVTYLFGKDVHDAMNEAETPYLFDDTVNIPQNEYEDLLEDSAFLEFLEETVGPSVWSSACEAFEKWNEESDDNE